MYRKVFTGIVVSLLMLQPLIMLSSLSFMSSQGVQRSAYVIAQEPGSRLSPGEYTNHVPIFINGSDDFEAKGWPGAGTAANPYVIEALNITRTLGVVLIQIINTDAHFVIRDCFLKQGSSMNALRIENTTNALVEYNTIYSAQQGINLLNTNDTIVSYTSVEVSTSNYALHADKCHDLAIQDSLLNSTAYRSTRIIDSHYLSISGCTFAAHPNWNAVYITASNYSSMVNNEVHNGLTVLNLFDSDGFTVDDLLLVNVGRGIYSENCPSFSAQDVRGTVTTDIQLTLISSPNSSIEYFDISGGLAGYSVTASNDTSISNSIINDVTQYGLLLATSHGVHIAGMTLSEIGERGFQCSSSSDLLIENNLLSDIGSDAIYITNCPDSIIVNNVIEDADGYGIRIENSHRPMIVSNSISDCDSSGIRVSDSHNGTASYNHISRIDNNGVDIQPGDNWNVSGNTIDHAGNQGIRIWTGSSAIVTGNDIRHTVERPIRVHQHPNLTLTFNTVFDSSAIGMHLSSTDRVLVEGNSVTNAQSGLRLQDSDNTIVRSCEFSNMAFDGVVLVNLENITFSDNTVVDALVSGLYLNSVVNASVHQNVFSNCGVHIERTGSIMNYNHSFVDNIVNGKDLLYSITQANVSLDGTQYGQIILVDCGNISITDGSFVRSSVAIILAFSENIHIHNLHTEENLYGVHANMAPNLTITDSTFRGKMDATGVYAYASQYALLLRNDFEYFYGGYGAYLELCSFSEIVNCTFRHSSTGLYVGASNNVTVSRCSFTHIDDVGFFGQTPTNHIEIIDSSFYNCSYGISNILGSNWHIADNEFHHCHDVAIFSIMSNDDNITRNWIESSGYGVAMLGCSDGSVTNNTIRWILEVGVYLEGSSSFDIHYNIIAFSGTSNAIDNSINTWDDGVDTGNWWSDYTPPPPYGIPGGGGSVDNYPNAYAPTVPIIDRPMDLYYAEGSTGNTITWNPRDDDLKNWTAYINGAFWAWDAWNFINVTVNVDGLPLGTHTIVLTVYDIHGNSVSDEVSIIVYDGTPPQMSSEADATFFVDGSGQTVTWTVSDVHPDDYLVYRDDELVETGTWTSGELSINFDGLSVGIYEYSVVIRDVGSNTASDTILVRVLVDDIAPTIDSPADLTYFVGETGNRIIWTPFDEWPDRYEIESNGSIVASANWSGSRVIYNVDGLDVGTYDFTVTVYDRSGRTASDTVRVVVRTLVVETPEEPLDLTLIMMAAGIAGAVILVIAAAYFIRKRRA